MPDALDLTLHCPLLPSRWPAVDLTQPGLGDLIAKVATPIARALQLKCIDRSTRQLRPDSGCAKRRDRYNEAGKKIFMLFQRKPPSHA